MFCLWLLLLQDAALVQYNVTYAALTRSEDGVESSPIPVRLAGQPAIAVELRLRPFREGSEASF